MHQAWAAAPAIASGCFLYLAGAQTGRAYADMPDLACNDSPHIVQIGQETAARRIVRMTDIVARHRAFITDIATLCHDTPRLKGAAL